LLICLSSSILIPLSNSRAFAVTGQQLILPVGYCEEQGDYECRQQLEVVRVKTEPEDHLDDNVIDYRADYAASELDGKVVRAVPEYYLTDDDRGKADDDSAAAHVHRRAALVLRDERARKGHDAVR